ncbi:hypothetical protein J9303_03530 [Bacillaceae bacterium Marseille-Q3522]|nr:hypothetical protein [Bacillaceae bacterium Marseille-Q3522]
MNNKKFDLRKAMYSTVLKELQFNEKNKLNVLKTIQHPIKKHKNFSLRKKLIGFLEATVTTAIVAFTIHQVVPFSDQAINKTDTIETKNIYIPNKKEESFQEMSEEEILQKLLNTMDYFETAKGRFEMYYDGVEKTKLNTR